MRTLVGTALFGALLATVALGAAPVVAHPCTNLSSLVLPEVTSIRSRATL